MGLFDIIKLLLVMGLCCSFITSTEAYDPLDPNGNITIRWDVMSWSPDGYIASVIWTPTLATITMFNFQKYRHIQQPGWTLGWTWAKEQFIWTMLGGQTMDQGDCSRFTGKIPHCCKKDTEVVDLLPGVPYDQQLESCCKGGILSSWIQDPAKAVSRFQITVADILTNVSSIRVPKKFTLKAPGPGYTCGPANIVEPTKFYSSDERRVMKAFKTWNVSCMYSQFLAAETPACCVSLSAFYNDTIICCPKCSCGCQKKSAELGNCVESKSAPEVPENPSSTPLLQCTNHMCPVHVHWHIKQNYGGYWRVKVTITNLNYNLNYSQWNVAVQHPNMNNVTRIFSFSYYPLAPYDGFNDTAMLWGLEYFNDILLQAGHQGNVQSDILLGKDKSTFTWENGWAFPRRIYFNGDQCVMPIAYPLLPTTTPAPIISVFHPAFNILLVILAYIFVGTFCKLVRV